MKATLQITDAQVHIWGANTPERPWPSRPTAPHRPLPFSKDDLLREMNAAGVQRAVVVPPTWEGCRNDLALEAARLHPDRLAVMGRIDFDAADARSRLAGWRRQPGMLGVRCSFFMPADEKPLMDGRAQWLWAEAEAHGVPIMVNVSAAQMPLIAQAARSHPGLKLTIDHLGIPKGTKDEGSFAHLDQLLALAQHPNIAVKASSLPTHTTDSYPYRRLHPYLRSVYDAFGPRRIFWGSDITKMPCSYRQAITMFTEEMPWFSDDDKQWIMGRGLCEWIGWKLP